MIIDNYFLREIGINHKISQKAIDGLLSGSLKFQRLFVKKNLTPDRNYSIEELLDMPLEIHNYTGKCPTNVFEVNPTFGSCSTSCLYCLVSDGDQLKPISVFSNYHKLVEHELERNKDKKCFFYFSPKTEAFSEPLLETGIAHNILRTFIDHYRKYPSSNARVFIASKAGPNHLLYKHKNDSIIDLLEHLDGKVQFNGSMGIMPPYLHEVLEPNATSFDDRLKAMKMLQSRGVYAYSVLAQPILPNYLDEKSAQEFILKLRDAKIQNIKPEFLTVNMENLAIIAQYVNYFDKSKMREFLEPYLGIDNQDHIKQRCRIAPDRKLSKHGIEMMQDITSKYGIGISICNWVKNELGLEDIDKSSKLKGFRCLGYQEKLFSM